MASRKTSTKVEILGSEYRIRTDASDTYVAEVARFVDSKLRELLGADGVVPRDRAAVLACMNIADQLFREREARRDEAEAWETRLKALTSLLEKETAVPSRSR